MNTTTPLGGLLNLNKPPGATSRDVVNQVQRLLPRKTKLGHAGTLDPLASGVLVVAVGPGTKLIQWVQQQPKRYQAEFILGMVSETDDVEGTLAPGGAPPADRQQIELLLPGMCGEQLQLPPAYSAIKVRGRRAYAMARGETVELQARPVQIHSLSLLGYEPPQLRLAIECGSGTYVRSIGRDLGEQLGCGAVMSALERTAIGRFTVDEATDPSQLRSEDEVRAAMRPLLEAVASLPQRVLDAEQLADLAHGRIAAVPPGGPPNEQPPLASAGEPPKEPAHELAVVDREGRLRGIARPTAGGLRPILNLPAESD